MTRSTDGPTAAQVYETARSRRLLGLWLITRTPVNRQYPCRCNRDRACDPKFCPCRGRTDLAGMPGRCCAVRATAKATEPHDTEMEAA